MNPRIRRLESDQAKVVRDFSGHPHVKIESTDGVPPEKYLVAYMVRGLVATGTDSFIEGTEHRAEIFLPLDYPRRAPFCRMITPVFHPNIDPQKICIGDHWSAGQSLSELIRRIGEMISFQSYNVKSPLNAHAAKWAEQNVNRLPLESADFSS
jgi:ubiquitin-protein ligase